jgi:solute carrier family 12 sodium/potassium/chloride transporter 2
MMMEVSHLIVLDVSDLILTIDIPFIGLTVLLPYIMQKRRIYEGCKLRIFTVMSHRGGLEEEQRSIATLLSKLRIDYSDLIVISDLQKKAKKDTFEMFNSLIEPWRKSDVEKGETSAGVTITDGEMERFKEKNNRHMRLRELLLQHSAASTMIFM